MYVWFVLGQAGFDYPYIPARDFPKSRVFKKVGKPRATDIAWWPEFVALYRGKDGILLSAGSEEKLEDAAKQRGMPVWYRYDGPPMKKAMPGKSAPRQSFGTADDALRRLDGAAWFPPRVKDDAERDRLGKEWEKAVSGLEVLRRSYPDDPQVLRRLGACYRMGFNLDMPGAWERAEAYLLRAEELAPKAPEAYISLGILYADMDFDHAEQAEAQFRQALGRARQEELPQIWWGLAVALYYQGRV
jgi:tetratricopeptide (TPR) repeat protein